MKRIPLTQGKFALVDDADFNWLNQWKWCVFFNGHSWRAVRVVRKKTIYMSRFMVDAPQGKLVDHHNHDTLDNQRHNLRICSCTQNNANQIIRNYTISKYKGVYWDKTRQRNKRWSANIKKEGKVCRLGRYLTEIEAAKAYDKKAKELFGEFAYLNFPLPL